MYQSVSDTAIVILSYNGKDLHRDFLPLISSEAKKGYDVFVIDNASTDGTGNFVKENFPDVKLISLPHNLGFTGGYAEGLKQIEAKYFVLLSADFEVTENWFQPLHTLMEKDSQIAACQPKIKYQKDKKMFEYAGASGAFIDFLGYPFCRGRIFFDLEEDKYQYQDTVETFWASGGCFMVQAKLYHDFGGLDQDFFAHMEEIDLCWRFKNAGYKIYCEPNSEVYHVGGSVITYGSPQKIFRNYRNSLIMICKNLPWSRLIWVLPLRIKLDLISAFRALLKGNSAEFLAVQKAHFSFFGSIFKWLGKRKESRKRVNQVNTKGIYPRSIIWDYFVKGKKTFNQLPIQDF